MTYTLTAKRQLDPGRASRNTFTAPLQYRRMCVVVIWSVKCIYQNWCSYFRGIVRNKLHYQKGMSTIYDKYTYPVKMTKGSLILHRRVETPSQHLFFNADVCETCYITKNIYIYLHATPKTKYYLILVLHT